VLWINTICYESFAVRIDLKPAFEASRFQAASRDLSRYLDNWSESVQISMRAWILGRAFLTCNFCSLCNSRLGCDTSASRRYPRAVRMSDAFCPAPLCTRPSCHPFSCNGNTIILGNYRLKPSNKEIRDETYSPIWTSDNALKLEIKVLDFKIRKSGWFSQRLLDRTETETTRWKQLIHISRFN
jgi:hypothetical protein